MLINMTLNEEQNLICVLILIQTYPNVFNTLFTLIVDRNMDWYVLAMIPDLPVEAGLQVDLA